MANAANLLTKVENEISGFSGISQLDNSDGTSVNVTIHNSTGGTVVSRNAAAGIYLENMTIVMAGAKFNLSYGTNYIYNLSTIYGDFTYNFTTPSCPGLGALHTGQTAGYTGTGGEDADVDGTSKSYTNSSCGTGTVGDDYTGLCWQWDDYDTIRTWEQALTYCNDLELGGHADWRLPTVNELSTMIDNSCDSATPAHCDSNFQNTAFKWRSTSDYYWSSTTSPDSTGYAYSAGMYNGYVSNAVKANTNYVRCVRSD